jgi:ATP-binding cassette subfamily F protein 3
VYKGNYDFYEEEKALRNELQQNAFDNQQQKIKQTEQFINRFRAKASKSRQVQSKVKMLDKIERVDAVVDENMRVNFKFNFSTKSGRHVKRGEHLSKAYGDLTILNETPLHIERGDKIALIGANGKGKSTLLRMVAGTENFQGKIETGHNVIQSFYAQHQLEALNINNDLIEELKQEGTGKTEQELRSVLGCFLFSNDEVFKKIKVLSGGEKSRVALAKTLISEANFLLLDEPTNHLDMLSVGILIQALQQYEGTFLVVSHDRHFITRIANKIWYIEDHVLKEYPGTYDEYVWWKAQQESSGRGGVKIPAPVVEKASNDKPKTEKPKVNAEDQQKERDLKKLEEQITVLEAQVNELEIQMADPTAYEDQNRFLQLNKTYLDKKKELDALMNKWESMA